ncbi:MAG TPA: hypothetical protein VF522_22790 [Ramlibacter sp.]|uniref:hypothetical protein n=1 Tax=Ramlibacter sp. TaxID=1917967 RepID=UPI002ED35BB1
MIRKAIHWVLLAAVFAAAAAAWWTRGPREEALAVLDPARIVLLRTPGGFLEVGALEKVEEFGWSSRYTCPLVDCPALLGPTISRIRVRAHYVYRVPLAAEWQLVREGDHYLLTVPEPQLQAPVAFHTADMQIQTTESSWLSPPAAPNREAVIRHLGPELAQRGADPAYLQAQRGNAEKTVQEFARKWMLEQGRQAALPLRVRFQGPDPR